ncbi:DNA polymerase IV [hydrothermal vent metagenome]|uniref:DNA-directed DNA polymerase n=1 Tax=hydrothermal vent metagenome TaxID=652676 RepID=A0A3B0U4J6_9ZZZZ
MQALPHLCRDCFDEFCSPPNQDRCPACGSSRLVAHDELHDLGIAHIDCDAFYAAVEKRDNPELVDKAVIIGGGARGVVATCCYIARMSGVRSAMPMFTARKKCPEAVIIKPNMEKYVALSRQIRRIMQDLSPLVEPVSIDEAFVDMSGTSAMHKAFPAMVLAKFAAKIEKEIGVSVSIGLSHNKFLAKIASDLNKPRGMALIGKKETLGFLAPKPISIINGVGAVFSQRLKKDGFVTIGQLQNHDPNDLAARYGEIGARLAQLAQGIDKRPVSIIKKVKSISKEITFAKNIADFDDLCAHLLALSERVSERMKEQEFVGSCVTLKLKTADFSSLTRTSQLLEPTQLAHIIYHNALQPLKKQANGTLFRLIGVGVSRLEKFTLTDIAKAYDPLDLVEPNVARQAAAERAMDKVRAKFGRRAVVRGKLYRQKETSRTHSPTNIGKNKK